MTKARSIPWPRILAEGGAIVVSILLAFGIQAWWEGRQDRREERAVLVGLESEFQDLEARLSFDVNLLDDVRRDIEWLLDSVPRAEAVPLPRIDAALRSAMWAGTFESGSGALDALITSRRLELIQNVALRARLSAWRSILDEAIDQDLTMRDYVVMELVPFLAANQIEVGRAQATARTSWGLRLEDAATAAQKYEQLLTTPQFRSLVQYRYTWALISRNERAEAAEAAREILELIRSEPL